MLDYERDKDIQSSAYPFCKIVVSRARKRTILLKYLKIYVDMDLKIILLDHQNNYVENSNMMNNIVKSFDILATSLSVIILISQIIYFQICIYLPLFRYFSKSCVLSVYVHKNEVLSLNIPLDYRKSILKYRVSNRLDFLHTLTILTTSAYNRLGP